MAGESIWRTDWAPFSPVRTSSRTCQVLYKVGSPLHCTVHAKGSACGEISGGYTWLLHLACNCPLHGGFEFQAQNEHLDLGNVLVGDPQSCSIVLLNDGICSLKYILSVEQLITGPCEPEEVHSDPLGGYCKEISTGWGLCLLFFSAKMF